MPKPLRWVLSLIFIVQMYLAMAVLAVVFAIPAILSRDMAFTAVHAFCRWVRWSAAVLVGLRSEIRGPVPQTEVRMPFDIWWLYRSYFLGQIIGASAIQLNEPVCGPTPVNK